MRKITLVFYSLFLLIFSVFSYYFVDPQFPYLPKIYDVLSLSSNIVTSVYILFMIIFFLFYAYFLNLLKQGKLIIRDVVMLVGISIIILFFSHPTLLSYDIYNYIATAKVTYFYKENPYIIMPIEFQGDSLLGFTHAANKVALYGPFWILLTIVPYILGFSNYLLTLFTFKLFVSLFYIGTLFLIWKGFKNLKAIVLFGFNPLVVTEILISGHNDIVMIFLVLLSYILILRNKILLGIIFFILSFLIKYATIFLLPIIFILVYKQIKKQKIDMKQINYLSMLSMMLIFLLSPLREEIYPWYAIWFLVFASLSYSNKLIYYLVFSFSVSLMFRYVPYMLLGNYLPPVQSLKTFITFFIPSLVFIYLIFKRKLWSKIF